MAYSMFYPFLDLGMTYACLLHKRGKTLNSADCRLEVVEIICKMNDDA